jgi:hypothetical protein
VEPRKISVHGGVRPLESYDLRLVGLRQDVGGDRTVSLAGAPEAAAEPGPE